MGNYKDGRSNGTAKIDETEREKNEIEITKTYLIQLNRRKQPHIYTHLFRTVLK